MGQATSDLAVDQAILLIAGYDEAHVHNLVTSWIWCEAHPEMPWVRPRHRKDAEVIRAVAGMLLDQPEAVAVVRRLAYGSPCKLHRDLHRGDSEWCFNHPGKVPCIPRRLQSLLGSYLATG